MRNFIKVNLCLIICSMGHQVISQDWDRDMLIGSWVFDYSTSISKMKSEDKQYLEQMENTRKEKLKSAYEGRRLRFFVDGKYKQDHSNGKSLSGKWKMENGLLKISNDQGKSKVFEVISLSSERLLLRPEGNSDGRYLFSVWYLSKEI